MAKKAKKNAVNVNPSALPEAMQKLVATVAACGFVVVNAFGATCDNVLAIVKATRPGSARNRALELAGNGYKAAYVIASLMRKHESYRKRFDNYDDVQMIEEGAAIISLAWPTSDKPERRTKVEHDACRAADVSWLKVREATGLKDKTAKKNKRTARPGSNVADNSAPKVSGETPNLTQVAPKLADNDAGTYFANAIAALLATVDVNADAVPKPWSEFINDTYQRAVAAKLIPSEK